MDFRQQHQTLLNFFGVIRMFKADMSGSERLALMERYWAPEDREAMLYWLSVALDTELLPFEPVPYSYEDGTSYRDDTPVTPEELVEALPDLSPDEVLEVLAELREHMFSAAYNCLRVVLSRDLSKFFIDKPAATGMFQFLQGSV